jgi:TPR repeat protein
MNTSSINSTELSGELSSLNIDNDSNESNNEETVTILCAACGKEGDENSMNACNKCDLVVYCNAVCKKKHRSRHKKMCERRVAELHDEALFKHPPPPEDCPICFLPLPLLGKKYKVCCGKKICSGCIHAVRLRNNGVGLCPFCRTPTPCSDQEMIERIKKRVEVGDADAIFNLGCDYHYGGVRGLPQDYEKALELYHQAGELGYAKAYNNIGYAYHTGEGMERDQKKANHYYELAAMGGFATARHNLGCIEARAGNWDRAIKHWLISVGAGLNDSVKTVQHLYKHGHATKEDYTNALLAYQQCLEEIRSEQRDKAAAYDDDYKYY